MTDLLRLHLEQQTNISAADVLQLLNGKDEEAIASPLWTGDAFYETNSGAVRSTKDAEKFSQELRAARESALHKVRLCIDEWINSANSTILKTKVLEIGPNFGRRKLHSKQGIFGKPLGSGLSECRPLWIEAKQFHSGTDLVYYL